jgi:hypothetical protein
MKQQKDEKKNAQLLKEKISTNKSIDGSERKESVGSLREVMANMNKENVDANERQRNVKNKLKRSLTSQSDRVHKTYNTLADNLEKRKEEA